MEITQLNLISDFEAGVKCLQSPPVVSQIFPFSGILEVPQLYRFCKWGALIFAILAAFGGLIVRIKILILGTCRIKLVSSSAFESIQLLNDEDFDESEDDDDDSDDDSCSSVESEDEGHEMMTSSKNGGDCSHQDNSVAGRRFSLSDFSAGKSVVKLWDSFTFGFDWEDDSEDDVVSSWDFASGNTFRGEKCRLPTIVLSAQKARNGGVKLGVYDSRIGRLSPAMSAEWPLRRRSLAGVISGGGLSRVYVRDDVTSALTVGDLRNVKSPLESPRGSDVGAWWDVDAVNISGGFVGRYR